MQKNLGLNFDKAFGKQNCTWKVCKMLEILKKKVLTQLRLYLAAGSWYDFKIKSFFHKTSVTFFYPSLFL